MPVARLQDVESFDNHDVGPAVHDLVLSRNDVVHLMGVNRSCNIGLPGLQVGHELEQAADIVAFRKTLPAHQTFLFKNSVRKQEAVGCNQVDLRMVRPPRQKCLNDSRSRALADGHAARDTDNVWDRRRKFAEKGIRRLTQVLRRRDIEVQEPRQRQVDLCDLVERNPLVDTAQFIQVRVRSGSSASRRAILPIARWGNGCTGSGLSALARLQIIRRSVE